MKNKLVSLTGLVMALIALQSQAQPMASIDQLSWMTGNWAGQLGPNVLEENWIAAEGGSIAALMRVTGGGNTNTFELITIEEAEGTLVLHIQQWDAGFVPRAAEAQEMVLEEIGDRSVKFRAVTEGSMASLGYSNPDAETFIIHVGRPDGSTVDLPLKKRSIW